MLDFYADWCVSCKEMEKYVFTAARRCTPRLRDYVLLQADVTANDATDQALMQRFGIIGPPMSLFFRDGQERRGLRLTGFEEARQVRASARSAAPRREWVGRRSCWSRSPPARSGVVASLLTTGPGPVAAHRSSASAR